jgi:hypothetical protein
MVFSPLYPPSSVKEAPSTAFQYGYHSNLQSSLVVVYFTAVNSDYCQFFFSVPSLLNPFSNRSLASSTSSQLGKSPTPHFT